jgi:hypothetical protein
MDDGRREHLIRFYTSLADLENSIGGERRLADCSGRMNWPNRGVYFFRESGENRTDTGNGPRIVRVGTHALRTGSGTTLWRRLSQHKGPSATGGGDHRGSIFRLLVGAALIRQHSYDFPTWGKKHAVNSDVKAGEHALECEVSQVIAKMPFLWLAIEDEPGPSSLRRYIETNSIALLSNASKPLIDPASSDWLGRHCNRDRVTRSGLWNSNHVDESYDPAFLDELDRLVLAEGVASNAGAGSKANAEDEREKEE